MKKLLFTLSLVGSLAYISSYACGDEKKCAPKQCKKGAAEGKACCKSKTEAGVPAGKTCCKGKAHAEAKPVEKPSDAKQ